MAQHIFTGLGPPSVAPTKVGQHYIDELNKKTYVSAGVASSTDWISSDGSASIAAHESALDPHPQYETSSEAQAKVDAHANLTNNPHAVTKSQVGLSNVDNTSDASKPISTATQTALDSKYDASNPNGYETPSQLNTRDANNRARANHTGTQLSSTISDFNSAASAAAPVQSVAGKTGTVTINKSDVGLGSVDNTSDLSKPISTATQSALDLKYNASNPSGYETPAQLNTRDTNNRNRSNHTGTQTSSTISDFTSAASAAAPVQSVAGKTGAVTLTKSDVGLGNVDNTSDSSKPISTATQSALDQKANLAGGNTFTGEQVFNETLGFRMERPGTTTPAYHGQSSLGSVTWSSNVNNVDAVQDTSKYQWRLTLSQGSDSLVVQRSPPGSSWSPVTLFQVFNNGNIFTPGKLGVGANAGSSAKLQLDSTTEGFLMPRLTSAQRLAISSPATGLQVYDTDLLAVCTYFGTGWQFDYRKLTSVVQSSTSTTYADITELITASLEAGLYRLDFRGIMQSTATGTGVGLKLEEETAAISDVCIDWAFSQSGNGTDKNFEYTQNALSANVTSASVTAANSNFPVSGIGMFRLNSAGSVVIQIRSENTSGVSIRPDSCLTISRVGN